MIGSDTRTVGILSRNVAMKKESSKPMNVLRYATLAVKHPQAHLSQLLHPPEELCASN
jgi:hypothetical protein